MFFRVFGWALATVHALSSGYKGTIHSALRYYSNSHFLKKEHKMQNEVKQEAEAEHRQHMTPTEVTQGRRVGLWKILAASLVLVVIGFVVVALFINPTGA
ncbi:MAG: hypothetical protein ACK4Y9_05740 [Hyphomonas sp.]